MPELRPKEPVDAPGALPKLLRPLLEEFPKELPALPTLLLPEPKEPLLPETLRPLELPNEPLEPPKPLLRLPVPNEPDPLDLPLPKEPVERLLEKEPEALPKFVTVRRGGV